MAVAFDPYAVLGVAPDADDAAVGAARRALLRRYHPDTARDLPDAAERTHAINAAYAAIAAERRAPRAATFASIAPPRGWPETAASLAPAPPQRHAGPTLAMILVFVGLPAMAMSVPGVPGHVAEIVPAEGAKAATFARSRLAQVRHLLLPAGFAAVRAAARPRFAPPPAELPAVATGTVASAVLQYRRAASQGDAAAFARSCADRAQRFPGWATQDFCVAFDLAADRLDEADTRDAYARLGAAPADAMARVEQVRALIDSDIIDLLHSPFPHNPRTRALRVGCSSSVNAHTKASARSGECPGPA